MKFFFCITVILLLDGCSKPNLPVNFSCVINGSLLQGNATTLYNPTTGSFQVLMNGLNSEEVALTWYYVDSLAGIRNLTDRTYPIPIQPPFTIIGGFEAPYNAATYSTGGSSHFGGSITLTNNTGPGGVISGSFHFNAINTNSPYYDTVAVTQGTFTNIAIASQ